MLKAIPCAHMYLFMESAILIDALLFELIVLFSREKSNWIKTDIFKNHHMTDISYSNKTILVWTDRSQLVDQNIWTK